MKENEANNIDVLKKNQVKMRQGVVYVSVTTCAKLLGVSKSTVYQMLKEGRIEGAFRINRSWRIAVIESKLKNMVQQEKGKK